MDGEVEARVDATGHLLETDEHDLHLRNGGVDLDARVLRRGGDFAEAGHNLDLVRFEGRGEVRGELAGRCPVRELELVEARRLCRERGCLSGDRRLERADLRGEVGLADGLGLPEGVVALGRLCRRQLEAREERDAP